MDTKIPAPVIPTSGHSVDQYSHGHSGDRLESTIDPGVDIGVVYYRHSVDIQEIRLGSG